MTRRCFKILSVVAVILLVNTLIVLGIYAVGRSDKLDVGVYTVRLMYEFDSPKEMVMNQSLLQDVLHPDEFERLQLDEPNRAVNAYYKFQFSSSRVVVEDSQDGFVLYRLVNENIDPSTRWVFIYSVDDNGKLYDIHEYEFCGAFFSGE